STLALNDGAHALVVGSISGVNGIARSEEHTSELQSRRDVVCRLLLEKKKEQNWGGKRGGTRAGGWGAGKRRAGRGGSIVLTSSAAGLQAYANIAHYVSFFFLMIGRTRTLTLFPSPPSFR